MAHLIHCPHFNADMFCDECLLYFKCPVKDKNLKCEDLGYDKHEHMKSISTRNKYGSDGINDYIGDFPNIK